jgi:RNA polymerase sigma factor (sigma-70 family)
VGAWLVPVDEIEALGPPSVDAASRTPDLVAAAYDRCQRELFSFALRASRNEETAEDLVHEAFVRLIVEIEADRLPGNVRAWLYRVVANLLISRARQATVAQRQLGAMVDRGEVTGPESAYLEQERDADLDLALGELGDDARTALLMAAGGFNGMEIAEAIGRTGSATRTLMCRSRLQLRHRLGAMGVAP